MDFTSSSPQILIFLLAVVIFSVLIYRRFYPEFFTRRAIRKKFALYLYKKHYQIVEDIDIICSNGERLYIKQLLVSRYGIYIIKTCHYRGIIYASHHQVKWMSKSFTGSKVFYNPHMEEESVIQRLSEYLHLSPSCFSVLTVFTGNSHFPPPAPTNTCKVDNIIRAIMQHRNILINPRLLPDIVTVLKIRQTKPPTEFKSVNNQI